MPAFWSGESGVALEHRVEGADAAARVLRAHWELLGRTEGVLVFVPPPAPVPREVVEGAVAAAVAEARARGLRGKGVTPFLLGAVARATGGRALRANLELLERNASVAAEIAAALARRG
jgi:pseudouridine-5'-phosphate glycosidase